MLKYISTAVFSILLFGVIILTAINYHNNDVLESRINTVTKYSKELKSEKSFKEDYYILQQSHDTNLILVVFGLMVAVIGFFTYQNVIAKFDLKAGELKNEIIMYKNEGQELINKLGDLQISFYRDGADIDYERSRRFLSDGNISDYLSYLLSCVEKNIEFYSLLLLKNPNEDPDYIIKTNIDILNEVDNHIGSIVNIPLTTSEIIEEHMIQIRKLGNKEIDKLLSKIHLKINIVTDSEFYES